MKQQPYYIKTLLSRFDKGNCRKNHKRKRRSGFFKFYFDVINTAKRKGKELTKGELPKFDVYTYHKSPSSYNRPEYSDNIKFLAENRNVFDRSSLVLPPDGIFKVPSCFSLSENYEQSFIFLKRLFAALYGHKFKQLVLDYQDCTQIDVDASVCMDVMLGEFINYIHGCRKRNIYSKTQSIKPVNYQNVAKILFSIGAFKNILGKEIKFSEIKPFHLIVGNNFSGNKGADKEIEVTKMVDYIVDCLQEMNRTLTWEAEDSLSKVIGEVLINAAEHSGRRHRYAIGYFEKQHDETSHLGIFNLTIFSFGNTIYENFKKPGSEELQVVHRMKELSDKYTSRNLFKSKEFEEETLWTLYALQEGVTSVRDKKRGNGSIQFIENFFSLKGDMEQDDSSFLTIMSGNTRIKFDGSYKIQSKQRGKDGKTYKMMTFNDSGDIQDKPDEKFVTFAANFFPGTLISAKIRINFNNVEQKEEHHDHLHN